MAKLATIDLEWLEDQISKMKGDLETSKKDTRHIPPHIFFKAGIDLLEMIYSKCTPIKEVVNHNALDALIELVELKDLKFMDGEYPSEEYLRRKPIAWENAKRIIKYSKL